eukprot:TRINITY_DN8985_c1_g1_i2.p3 TRINITY_DN8985_c1_g1~~TRINITY_DN8985_c1_g1_i2.p3  ORF type:complete len:188 (-),score=14.17 TRINITY_DN8985_c1_g1_i2:359-922(-)
MRELESFRIEVKCLEFTKELASDIEILLDELIMSYIVNSVVKVIQQSRSIESFAEQIFTNIENKHTIDYHAFRIIKQDDLEKYEVYDPSAMCVRLKQFLKNRVQDDNQLVENEDFVRRLGFVLQFVLYEILELANNCARDSRRPKIVPQDIRICVYSDQELFKIFECCSAFWYPIDTEEFRNVTNNK